MHIVSLRDSVHEMLNSVLWEKKKDTNKKKKKKNVICWMLSIKNESHYEKRGFRLYAKLAWAVVYEYRMTKHLDNSAQSSLVLQYPCVQDPFLAAWLKSMSIYQTILIMLNTYIHT